ncbi:hypothetical protein [Acetobacter indonesiensis]|uniref:hypothetical protein n=1 Tax=Acetobacter indonesiensis TaxID=104101 RepID=UPI0039EB730E
MQIQTPGGDILVAGHNNPTKIEINEFERLTELDEQNAAAFKENFKFIFGVITAICFVVLLFTIEYITGARFFKSLIWSAILGPIAGLIITMLCEPKTSDEEIRKSLASVIGQYNSASYKNIYTYREGRSILVVNSAGMIVMNEWPNKFGATVLFPQNILSARVNTQTKLNTTTKESGSFTVGAGKGIFGGYSTGRTSKSETVAEHKHTFELRYQLYANSEVQLKTINFGSNREEAESLCDLVCNLR